MSHPRLLDLFSGAGGAAMGYYRAGFRVVGVDHRPQPHYPFEFHQADALEYLAEHGAEYDAIHASPPCQFVTRASQQWRVAGKVYPNLIPSTREAIRTTGKLYIIENVMGAPLLAPIMLTGGMFGLRVKRDRLFETNFRVAPIPQPKQQGPAVKMGRPFDARGGGSFYPVGHFSGVAEAREAMGIGWMTGAELTQAIPPAYTEYIGRQLLEAVRKEREV